jgi:hypothetical protein
MKVLTDMGAEPKISMKKIEADMARVTEVRKVADIDSVNSLYEEICDYR